MERFAHPQPNTAIAMNVNWECYISNRDNPCMRTTIAFCHPDNYTLETVAPYDQHLLYSHTCRPFAFKVAELNKQEHIAFTQPGNSFTLFQKFLSRDCARPITAAWIHMLYNKVKPGFVGHTIGIIPTSSDAYWVWNTHCDDSLMAHGFARHEPNLMDPHTLYATIKRYHKLREYPIQFDAFF